MKVKLLQVFIIFSMLQVIISSEVTAAPSISTITTLAKEAVAKKIDVPANSKVEITPQIFDNRLSIPDCESPIQAKLASNRAISKNNTVKVSCDVKDLAYPWQIYVSVKVSILFPIVVAKETIASGSLIETQQLAIRYVEQSVIRGQQFNTIEELSGTRVKRRIAKHHPIFESNLCFVCKGDSISIYARTSNVVIKTLGEALRDGNLGDTIRVKNARSNKTLDARVTGIGEVEIKM